MSPSSTLRQRTSGPAWAGTGCTVGFGADARGAAAVWSFHVAPGGNPAVESDAAGGDVLGAATAGDGSFHWMVEPGGNPGAVDDGAEEDGGAEAAEELDASPGVFQWIVDDSACGCTEVDGSAGGAL